MPRITTPEELFFPVATQPVYTRQTDVGSGTEIPISNRLAVVNVRTNEVPGVLGTGTEVRRARPVDRLELRRPV